MKNLHTLLLAMLVFVGATKAYSDPLPPSYEKRKKEAQRQLKEAMAFNKVNDAFGMSHLNRYIISDDPIMYKEESRSLVEAHFSRIIIDDLNAKLAIFDQNSQVKLYVYLSAIKAQLANGVESLRYKITEDGNAENGLSYTEAAGLNTISETQAKHYEARLLSDLSNTLALGENDSAVLIKFSSYLSLNKVGKVRNFYSLLGSDDMKNNEAYFYDFFKSALEKQWDRSFQQRFKLFVESAIQCFNAPMSRQWDEKYMLSVEALVKSAWLKESKARGAVQGQRVLEKLVIWNFTKASPEDLQFDAVKWRKLIPNGSKKLTIVITNEDTKSDILDDIEEQKEEFALNSGEMLLHFHFTGENRMNIAQFLAPDLVQEISKGRRLLDLVVDKAIPGLLAPIEDALELARAAAEVAIQKVEEIAKQVKVLTDFIVEIKNTLSIPRHWWNARCLNIKQQGEELVACDDCFGQYQLGILPKGLQITFAFIAGIWDGLLEEVTGLAEMVSLVIDFAFDKELRNQMIDGIKSMTLKSILESFKAQIDDFANCGDHYRSYRIAKGIVSILAMFTGAGAIKNAITDSGSFFANLGKSMLNNAKNMASNAFRMASRIKKLSIRGVKIIQAGSQNVFKIVSNASEDIVLAIIDDQKINVRKWISVDQGNVNLDAKIPGDNTRPDLYIAISEDGSEVGICLRNGSCFVAGTSIFMAQKTFNPIEKIAAGQKVYAENPKNCQVATKPVETTFVRTTRQLIQLGFAKEIIYATPEHPFFNLHHQQILAGNLHQGDTLKTYDGYAIVQQTRQIDTTATVYNFHVKDFETYFVGKTRLLVHNMASHIKFDANVRAKINDLNLSDEEISEFASDMLNNEFKQKITQNTNLMDGWLVLLRSDNNSILRLNNNQELNNILEYIKNTKQSIDDVTNDIKKANGYDRWKSYWDEIKTGRVLALSEINGENFHLYFKEVTTLREASNCNSNCTVVAISAAKKMAGEDILSQNKFARAFVNNGEEGIDILKDYVALIPQDLSNPAKLFPNPFFHRPDQDPRKYLKAINNRVLLERLFEQVPNNTSLIFGSYRGENLSNFTGHAFNVIKDENGVVKFFDVQFKDKLEYEEGIDKLLLKMTRHGLVNKRVSPPEVSSWFFFNASTFRK